MVVEFLCKVILNYKNVGILYNLATSHHIQKRTAFNIHRNFITTLHNIFPSFFVKSQFSLLCNKVRTAKPYKIVTVSILVLIEPYIDLYLSILVFTSSTYIHIRSPANTSCTVRSQLQILEARTRARARAFTHTHTYTYIIYAANSRRYRSWFAGPDRDLCRPVCMTSHILSS